MARTPLAIAESLPAGADAAQVEQVEQDTGNESGATKSRNLGPKVVYIQLREGIPKDAVLSVHTNTRTLVDSMEQNQGSSYVKHTLPQGEPRKRG